MIIRKSKLQLYIVIVAGALVVGLNGCDQAGVQSGKIASTYRPPAAASSQPTVGENGVILKEKVIAAVAAEPGLGAVVVDANPADGTVTLSGTTDSDANRMKAAQIALNVEGVKSVQNNLVVKQPT